MRHLAYLLSVGLVGGCNAAAPAADAGADSDADTDADTDTGSEEVPASTGTFAAAFTQGAGPAAGLGSPFVGDGDALEQRDAPSQDDGRAAAEHSVGGDSVVTDAGCVTFSWAELSATLTFTNCILETTGQTLNGSVTLAVRFDPTTSFTTTLTALSIDAESYDGSVSLAWAEGRLGPALGVDLTYASGGASTHLVLTDVTVTATATTATLSGGGSLDVGEELSAAFTMDAVTWEDGHCLPTSGSVSTPSLGPLPVTVTFLQTTPADGIVNVAVGAFLPTPQPLLTPCP